MVNQIWKVNANPLETHYIGHIIHLTDIYACLNPNVAKVEDAPDPVKKTPQTKISIWGLFSSPAILPSFLILAGFADRFW